MNRFWNRASVAALVSCLTLLYSGCGYCQRARMFYQPPPPANPLGAHVDPLWKIQEANAEASDFVIYQHEFELNGTRLNTAGEDHVKEVAARLNAGQDMQVLVERSMTTAREDTEFKYPVHPNPELDMKRREVIVRSLAVMGVPDAEQRVVVAPSMAEGFKATEAQRSYSQALQGGGQFGRGYGFGGGFFGPFSGFGFGF